MRKAIAGVLMGAAVLSLAACGKSDTAQTTAAQAAESADSTAAAVIRRTRKRSFTENPGAVHRAL